MGQKESGLPGRANSALAESENSLCTAQARVLPDKRGLAGPRQKLVLGLSALGDQDP
jgi:hypothetical protein